MARIDQLIEAIRGESEDASALLEAAFVFEKVTLRRAGGDMGWPAWIADGDFDRSDVDSLREAVVGLVRRDPTADLAATAVWALGKLVDEELTELLTEVVRANVSGNDRVLYQALVALDTLGHFPEHDSWSLSAVEENRSRARAFLEARRR